MRVFFFIVATAISMNAAVVCCCDDSVDTLTQEAMAFGALKSLTSSVKSETAMRISRYDVLLQLETDKLGYGGKKLNASSAYRDATSIKENFELEAASAKINAAKIVNAQSAAEVRQDIGREAEEFIRQK